MAGQPGRGPVVVDTDAYSARLVLRLDVPLVSNDGVFDNTPGLQLETARS